MFTVQFETPQGIITQYTKLHDRQLKETMMHGKKTSLHPALKVVKQNEKYVKPTQFTQGSLNIAILTILWRGVFKTLRQIII